MDRPQSILIPTLHAGYRAIITWSAVDDAITYNLERKLNNDVNFVPIYNGAANFFEDVLPVNAATAEYRVQAVGVSVEYTWDELEAFERDWDAWDSLDWVWESGSSEFTLSETKEVIPNRPPVINGQDRDLGIKYKGFDIVFNAVDPDPENTIDLQVTLNNDVIFTMPTAQQGANYTATITDEQVFAMEEQSQNIIVITATDNWGLSDTRTFTFTATEDLTATAVFYVLRDGKPVASIGTARQWTDYLQVGEHRYRVRGVDRYGNFSDSNEVTVTITLRHATLALTSSPGKFANLIVRRSERPQMGRSFNINYTETWYEGRSFPVYDYSGQRRNAIPLAFTTTTLQEQQALFEMISKAEVLVYRDQYENRVIGVVPEFASDFQGRFRNQDHNAIIDFNITINQADFNEVIEYD